MALLSPAISMIHGIGTKGVNPCAIVAPTFFDFVCPLPTEAMFALIGRTSRVGKATMLAWTGEGKKSRLIRPPLTLALPWPATMGAHLCAVAGMDWQAVASVWKTLDPHATTALTLSLVQFGSGLICPISGNIRLACWEVAVVLASVLRLGLARLALAPLSHFKVPIVDRPIVATRPRPTGLAFAFTKAEPPRPRPAGSIVARPAVASAHPDIQ